MRLNRVTSLGEQRQILLSAGDGNVVEKIDLAELAREGAPALKLLQPAYLCSSAEVAIRSTPCDAATMSWARAPYVYRTETLDSAVRHRRPCACPGARWSGASGSRPARAVISRSAM